MGMYVERLSNSLEHGWCDSFCVQRETRNRSLQACPRRECPIPYMMVHSRYGICPCLPHHSTTARYCTERASSKNSISSVANFHANRDREPTPRRRNAKTRRPNENHGDEISPFTRLGQRIDPPIFLHQKRLTSFKRWGTSILVAVLIWIFPPKLQPCFILSKD